jgi:hypothetical protein
VENGHQPPRAQGERQHHARHSHGESLGSYAKGTDAYKTLKNYFDIKGSEHIPAAQMNTNKEALFTELGVNSYDGLTNALVSGGLNQEDASKVTHLYQHSEALERINQNLDSPVALRDEMTAIYQDFTGSIDVPDAREIKNLFKEIGMPTNTAVFNQMVRYALQPSSEVKAGSRFESDGVDVANYIENMGTDEYLEAVSTRFLTEGESMQNAAQNDFKDIREMFGQDSNRFSQALNTGFPNNQLSSEEAGEFLGLMSGTQTHQDVGRMQELIGKIDPGFQDFLLENAPEGSTSGVDEKYGFATTKSFRALNAMFQESIHEVVTVEHKSFEGELPEVDGYFDLGILGVAKISYKNNSSSSNSWIQTNPVKGNKNGPLTECELFK